MVNSSCLPHQTKDCYLFSFPDEAFTLREDFLKPYTFRDLNGEKRIFNYCLSRVRRVVGNALGILLSRFRVLRSEINLRSQKTENIVKPSYVLHNFLRRNNSATYTPAGSVNIENPVTYEIQEGLHARENIVAVARGQCFRVCQIDQGHV